MYRPVFLCSGCGRRILEGERVTHLLGEQWCAECVETATEVAVKIEDDANGNELLHSRI